MGWLFLQKPPVNSLSFIGRFWCFGGFCCGDWVVCLVFCGFFCVVVYLFLHNSLNSSAVCCGILLLQKYLPVFVWNFNTFKLQHCLQGLLLLLAQLFMMCQNQGRPCKVTPGACRALFLPLPTNSWAVELFAPNAHPLCNKVMLTTCFESSVAALLMPGCFCSSPESFLLFHQHAEGQNYMSCF